MPDPVVEQLLKARDRLLDLTLANRLLNYRPPKRAGLRVVDERLDIVWRQLVDEGRDFQFLAREEYEGGRPAEAPSPSGNGGNGGAAPSPEADDPDGESFSLPEIADEPAEGAVAKRHSDRFLQTAATGEALQTSLLRLYQASSAAVEELGVSVLFLAMGFLAWKPEDREEPVRAPIFLVPVELERTSARRRFKLSPLDDDPVLNPCLARKLQADFSIAISERPETWDEFAPTEYLGSLREMVAGREGWEVTEDICLGLFSFTKYLMYLDLDPATWPEGRPLTANPLIRALCDDAKALEGAAAVIPSAVDLDAVDPESILQVVDADSSQQVAIAAAKAGASMVIQGPPGTGKSQTITNIIAECMAAGKTVLFVSQKMAALEVVKSRLERVGLGDFCLELHSTKARRSNVLGELERVLSSPLPAPPPVSSEARQLAAARDRLNSYVRALHEPVEPSNLTPYYAIGRVALLRNIPNVICRMPGCEEWSRDEVERTSELIRGYARQLESVWPPARHVWRGVRLTALTGRTRHETEELLTIMQSDLAAVGPAAADLAAILGLQAPGTLGVMGDVRDAARHILESPEPAARLIEETRWDKMPRDAKVLLATLKSYSDARSALAKRFDVDKAKLVDWRLLAERAERGWRSIGRFFSRDYWRDRAALRRVMLEGYKPGTDDVLRDVSDLGVLSALRAELDAADTIGRSSFDEHWRGPESSWQELSTLAEWLVRARELSRAYLLTRAGVALCLKGADRTELAAKTVALDAPLSRWSAALAGLTDILELQDPGWFESPASRVPLDTLAARLAAMSASTEPLVDWTQYEEMLQACERSDAADFVAKALAAEVEPETLALAFEKAFLSLWVEEVFAEREALRQFSGPRHEDTILDFARLDSRWVRETRNRLYAHLASARPMTGFEAARSSQVGILQAEIRRKRGGRSIRRVLKDAGAVVQRVKPCYKMSPLSVAQFLDPESVAFDVVIFDEASQVEPADALGAIARGAQLLLVGDRKQLPPTSFFTSLSSDTGHGEDVDVVWEGIESILDRGEAVLPALPLRWHYRSRHESLIEFSNAEFYNGELIIFPSCHAGHDEMGVTLRYEPADLYDRARSRTNREQARRVAAAVFDHFRRFPDKSLGVATFSAAQQQAVLDEVERMRREDDSLEDFFNPALPEHFFVKNLETIQGDERDVIFISVGHGRSAPGERIGAQISNLAGENGWRRLNVLVTRARERCVVFSSVLARELDISGTTARGVTSFKGYLEFVETGKLPAAAADEGESASPFEEAVYNTLTEKGLTLHRHVGSAGCAIDMAVVDPDDPGRYILAVECDGGAYRSSATARDRDRLRRQVLEGLGWRIHRVWSADWYRRPESECDRIMDAVAKARAGQLQPLLANLSPDQSRTQWSPPHAASAGTASQASNGHPIPVEPYRMYEATDSKRAEEFYTAPLDKLAALVGDIVALEGPIHASELVRRVAAQYGIGRVGSRIEERVLSASRRCRGAVIKNEFYWPAGMDTPHLRRRDDSIRDVDLVCLEELGLAARLLVKAQFGMSRDDLAAQVAKLLGFAPSSTKVKGRVGDAIDAEIAGGRLSLDAYGMVKPE